MEGRNGVERKLVITMYSNFLNHHQRPFCEEMYTLLGDGFHFVATEEVSPSRLAMGYDNMNAESIPYLIKAYETSLDKTKTYELSLTSDVIIWGSAPTLYYLERVKQDKLTFVYSERIWKKGAKELTNPRKIASYIYHHTRFWNKHSYLLAASAFSTHDFNMLGAYRNKAFKWGYFPPTVEYPNMQEMISKKKPLSLLWVGRLIKFKHPETAVMLADKLKSENLFFEMTIIGDGELFSYLNEMIHQKGLENQVKMLGSIPQRRVRKYMEESEIFLFTSDKGEGWGAVLNEAMNSACVVVANSSIGSVPYLINDGHNGYVYETQEQLFYIVSSIIGNRSQVEQIGCEAYKTIISDWNAKTAAERLIALSYSILDGTDNYTGIFSSGPCSKAN